MNQIERKLAAIMFTDIAGYTEKMSKDDGTQIGVTACPNGCGKIKSPQCCGDDMSCEV